jgi:predicted  nucleic acid-binding Zn-ribbon protein
MSNVQDLIDLTSKLLKSVADKQLVDELSHVQSLISKVETEYSSVKTSYLDLKVQMVELKKEHLQEVSNLVCDVSRLNAGIDKLKQEYSVDLVKLNDLVAKYKKHMGLSTEAQPLGIVLS